MLAQSQNNVRSGGTLDRGVHNEPNTCSVLCHVVRYQYPSAQYHRAAIVQHGQPHRDRNGRERRVKRNPRRPSGARSDSRRHLESSTVRIEEPPTICIKSTFGPFGGHDRWVLFLQHSDNNITMIARVKQYKSETHVEAPYSHYSKTSRPSGKAYFMQGPHSRLLS